MTRPVPRETVLKLRKLARLAADLPHAREAAPVTRLTSLKGLCQDPAAAHAFVTYLAEKTLKRVRRGQGRSAPPDTPERRRHREMMNEALGEMKAWLRGPTESRRSRLRDLLARMREEQNEYENIKWGAVRIVRDWDLLLFEYALHGLLSPPPETGHWAYQTARHYAERYDSGYSSGLTPKSAPLVRDIVNFWTNFLDVDLTAAPAPARPNGTRARKPRRRAFTPRQGQFLAFIHRYWQLHRQGPAELDLVKFFRVTPPAVHDMIVRLEALGLVTRDRGVARSVRVAVPEETIPELRSGSGPPW